ncbi:hypothetical protein [Nocardia higoensis]|uniref:hypothetical protein n=1 Tax=Nocardia higoensis TaxID=228599 RepID=UPI0002ED0440|nr:hypothetical protein [Nocardia higoensis]
MKSDTVTPDEVSADAPGPAEAETGEAQAAAVGDDEPADGGESGSGAVELGKKEAGSGKSERVTDRPDEADRASGGAEDGTAKQAPGARSRIRGLLTPVLAVLVVALAVAVGVLGWQVNRHNEIDAAGRAAQDAAERYAVALTSIDSKDLDSDFATVLDGATGAFKDMYGQSSAQLKQLLIDNNATGQGSVVDSAIKSASEDRAEILLFVDQTVTNSAAPEPRIDRSRVVMTMEKVDGRWLAAQVTLP